MANWTEFLDWFRARDYHPGVYLLGCYSRYVTLYSQQVRALNLIAALHETNAHTAATPVLIVGAGGAGLTASAAAALLGAEVTLLEQLDGPMELQANNRQRFVHPHIYDWPWSHDPSDRARLPILDWRAGAPSR